MPERLSELGTAQVADLADFLALVAILRLVGNAQESSP